MSQLVIPWPENAFWKKWALRLTLLAIVLYVAYVVRQIWLPLGLAFLLATVLDPVVDRMEKRGWKRAPATAFIFFSFILAVVGMIVLAFPYVLDQLGTVQQSITKYFPDTSQHGLILSFTKLKAPVGIARVLAQVVVGLQNGILKSSSWMSEYGMSFLGNLVWVVFVPLVGYYALRDYHILLGKALLLVPKNRRGSMQIYIAEVSAVFARYLRGLAIVSFLNGLATWGLLSAIRVPNALLLGIVAGILYSVPYAGALITVVLTGAISFVGGGLQLLVLAVGLSMVLHQLIFDQIVTPRILGGQVGIHPIISVIALLVGNLMFGIIGMILAVPIAACIQIGVLGLVPKLREVIDFEPDSTADTPAVKEIASETKEEHLDVEDGTDLHSEILQAVDHLESQMDSEKVARETT